ncbi:hypothetical protein DBR06_SOUSAS11710050, partial [Sousa chinensis]
MTKGFSTFITFVTFFYNMTFLM